MCVCAFEKYTMPLGTVKSWALLLAALLSSTTITTALQVTPNSPCASLCLDPAGSADPSTPNIHEDDIVCSNRDYAGEKGQKFQGCMNCLQNSTYSQGSQNDQAWFMCTFLPPHVLRLLGQS